MVVYQTAFRQVNRTLVCCGPLPDFVSYSAKFLGEHLLSLRSLQASPAEVPQTQLCTPLPEPEGREGFTTCESPELIKPQT